MLHGIFIIIIIIIIITIIILFSECHDFQLVHLRNAICVLRSSRNVEISLVRIRDLSMLD